MDELGIKLNSVENPIDFDSPDWSTLLGVYGGNAQSENDKIRRRTIDGIIGHLERGEWANKAPFGYKNVRISKTSTHIEIDETKAPLIRAIFKDVAQGVENASYIHRKYIKQGELKLKETAFFNMLRNRFYIAEVRVPKYKDTPAHYVHGVHEPLIDRETFDMVQDVLDGKRKHSPKLSKPIRPELFLRKFLVCPQCGHALTGATSSGNGGKYSYYFCCENQKHIRVRAEQVNETFAQYLAQLKPNKAVLELYNEVLKDLRMESKQDKRKMVSKLQDEIYTFTKRQNNAEDKYMDGEITKEQYNQMFERFNREIAERQERINILTTENRKNIEPQLAYAICLINNIDTYIRTAPVEVKIKLLGSMFPEKIEFDGENYRTNSFNKILEIIYHETNRLQRNKKTESLDFSSNSASVPRAGVEPAQG